MPQLILICVCTYLMTHFFDVGVGLFENKELLQSAQNALEFRETMLTEQIGQVYGNDCRSQLTSIEQLYHSPAIFQQDFPNGSTLLNDGKLIYGIPKSSTKRLKTAIFPEISSSSYVSNTSLSSAATPARSLQTRKLETMTLRNSDSNSPVEEYDSDSTCPQLEFSQRSFSELPQVENSCSMSSSNHSLLTLPANTKVLVDNNDNDMHLERIQSSEQVILDRSDAVPAAARFPKVAYDSAVLSEPVSMKSTVLTQPKESIFLDATVIIATDQVPHISKSNQPFKLSGNDRILVESAPTKLVVDAINNDSKTEDESTRDETGIVITKESNLNLPTASDDNVNASMDESSTSSSSSDAESTDDASDSKEKPIVVQPPSIAIGSSSSSSMASIIAVEVKSVENGDESDSDSSTSSSSSSSSSTTNGSNSVALPTKMKPIDAASTLIAQNVISKHPTESVVDETPKDISKPIVLQASIYLHSFKFYNFFLLNKILQPNPRKMQENSLKSDSDSDSSSSTSSSSSSSSSSTTASSRAVSKTPVNNTTTKKPVEKVARKRSSIVSVPNALAVRIFWVI